MQQNFLGKILAGGTGNLRHNSVLEGHIKSKTWRKFWLLLGSNALLVCSCWVLTPPLTDQGSWEHMSPVLSTPHDQWGLWHYRTTATGALVTQTQLRRNQAGAGQPQAVWTHLPGNVLPRRHSQKQSLQSLGTDVRQRHPACNVILAQTAVISPNNPWPTEY